ncbi:MAG TPA: alpha-L-fucosidase [Planctomycetaceae bacterium]|nr:alpha-L-fucosidase [Planctomycetaceae bacterium]
MLRTTAFLAILGIGCFVLTGFATAAEKAPAAQEATPQSDAAKAADMEWWRDARFGMFIHWGVYSVPAGTYQGKKIPWIGEWIMLRGKIPVGEYKKYAKDFNPVKYDADAWVRLAKEAGMKYIVITSKHHDGFALYDSKVTDWDVVDATPYGKDLLRPLEEACKKHGMKLGFYYSQAQDWTHPGGAKSGYEEGTGWDKAHDGDFDEYLDKIAIPQVREILGGYDIDVLWWDTPRWMNKERADRLLPLLDLRPGIVWNNRLGGDYKGCFTTPEQRIPDTGLDYDWETCMTLNQTWGYKSFDHAWKTPETLIRNLVDIASKGGNFLLNVGPTKEGEIPSPSIKSLKEIGAWMKVNGESIYGTTASPFEKPQWGRYTKKPGILYAHVFEWPAIGTLEIPLKDVTIKSVRLLTTDGPVALKYEQNKDRLKVHVTEKCPDPIPSVVVIEYADAAQ